MDFWGRHEDEVVVEAEIRNLEIMTAGLNPQRQCTISLIFHTPSFQFVDHLNWTHMEVARSGTGKHFIF